ncbi:hypothetical protein Dfri01_59040 [Dyadobacter frigoris]|uniref:hypothetical protein n=1 Tax=Dyadobacter frigoris TaxID=2576211 RepID=UPI0024A3299F|nr:hypothetical protein [Dyadobacter frigoris]GLU56443.1 hypothetical protein Dfri01_59040 [Dyadobacter frigoris]
MKIELISSAVLFIEKYRKMELADNKSNEHFIKKVVSTDWIAEHLCDAWRQKRNDFGDFFLNLDDSIQGDFIEAWGISVPGLKSYKDELEDNPEYGWDNQPPEMIFWLFGLVKYFYNNGIGGRKDVILPVEPPEDKRFGNSTNWGDYILSMSGYGRDMVLHQIYDIVMSKYKVSG